MIELVGGPLDGVRLTRADVPYGYASRKRKSLSSTGQRATLYREVKSFGRTRRAYLYSGDTHMICVSCGALATRDALCPLCGADQTTEGSTDG